MCFSKICSNCDARLFGEGYTLLCNEMEDGLRTGTAMDCSMGIQSVKEDSPPDFCEDCKSAMKDTIDAHNPPTVSQGLLPISRPATEKAESSPGFGRAQGGAWIIPSNPGEGRYPVFGLPGQHENTMASKRTPGRLYSHLQQEQTTPESPNKQSHRESYTPQLPREQRHQDGTSRKSLSITNFEADFTLFPPSKPCTSGKPPVPLLPHVGRGHVSSGDVKSQPLAVPWQPSLPHTGHTQASSGYVQNLGQEGSQGPWNISQYALADFQCRYCFQFGSACYSVNGIAICEICVNLYRRAGGVVSLTPQQGIGGDGGSFADRITNHHGGVTGYGGEAGNAWPHSGFDSRNPQDLPFPSVLITRKSLPKLSSICQVPEQDRQYWDSRLFNHIKQNDGEITDWPVDRTRSPQREVGHLGQGQDNHDRVPRIYNTGKLPVVTDLKLKQSNPDISKENIAQIARSTRETNVQRSQQPIQHDQRTSSLREISLSSLDQLQVTGDFHKGHISLPFNGLDFSKSHTGSPSSSYGNGLRSRQGHASTSSTSLSSPMTVSPSMCKSLPENNTSGATDTPLTSPDSAWSRRNSGQVSMDISAEQTWTKIWENDKAKAAQGDVREFTQGAGDWAMQDNRTQVAVQGMLVKREKGSRPTKRARKEGRACDSCRKAKHKCNDEAHRRKPRPTPPPITTPKPIQRRKRAEKACQNCKQRKTKCDEGKPACLACLKSDRPCDGYDWQTPSQSKSDVLGGTHTRNGESHPKLLPRPKIETDTAAEARILVRIEPAPA